jgi:hypothetical protein
MVIRNKITGMVVTDCAEWIACLRLERYPQIWEELIEVADELSENNGLLEQPEPPKPKTTRKRKPKAE